MRQVMSRAAGLGLAVFLMLAGRASADFALTNTDLDANSNGKGPPLLDVTSIDVSPLRFYTNTFSGAGVGADVRMVFAGTLSAAHGKASYDPLNGPGNAKTFMTVLGALLGTETAAGGGVFALNIITGGFGLYASTTNIDTTNPTTWAPPNTSATPFATFTLGPKTGVVPGSTDAAASAQLTVLSSIMNAIATSPSDPNQLLGNSLFLNTPGGMPGAGGFLLQGNTSAPQPPFGLFSSFGQMVESNVNAANSGLANDNDLAILNNIAGTFIGGNWATGIGAGPDSNWNPLFNPNGSSLNGDFRATGVGVELVPFAVPLPEPASIALMGMGLGGFVLAIHRRKNKVQAKFDVTEVPQKDPR